ncbi:hypothetical protein [Streptomyces catenulae]|uniref:Uncharacterized protein n=1 Tax=Streptomyces catenulae TaxID=66875 RepID=A0ABV2YWU9_9ACTN
MTVNTPPPPGSSPQSHLPLWRRLREDEWPPLTEVLQGRQGQTSPGVLLVLLLPCLWWLTVPLAVIYQLARTARRVARRLFPSHPEGNIQDPEVIRVQRIRAWVALALSGALLAAFGDWHDVADAQQQFNQRLLLAPWLALPSAALVVALLFWVAGPEARRTMRTRLWPAGRSALWYFGAWILVPLLFMAAFQVMSLAPHRTEGLAQTLLLLIVLFALWTPFWWVVFFLVFASGPALRHAFNLSTLHAALPALVTSVLVWVFAAVSLTSGDLPPGPPRGLRPPRRPGVGDRGRLVGDPPPTPTARGAVARLTPRGGRSRQRPRRHPPPLTRRNSRRYPNDFTNDRTPKATSPTPTTAPTAAATALLFPQPTAKRRSAEPKIRHWTKVPVLLWIRALSTR